jgi:hypothetical protein
VKHGMVVQWEQNQQGAGPGLHSALKRAGCHGLASVQGPSGFGGTRNS